MIKKKIKKKVLFVWGNLYQVCTVVMCAVWQLAGKKARSLVDYSEARNRGEIIAFTSLTGHGKLIIVDK